jgi:hypothetical protein
MMRASHHKSHFDQPNRVRCRNTKCRSKLPIPTSNDHKAFCTPYCRNQFYFWKCVVCEQPIQKGKRRKQPDHCHRRECRLSFGRYPETYLFAESPPDSPTCDHGSRSDSRSAVTNANRLFVNQRVGKTAVSRRYRDLLDNFVTQYDAVDEADIQRCRTLAGLSIAIELTHEKMVTGGETDPILMLSFGNQQNRIMRELDASFKRRHKRGSR